MLFSELSGVKLLRKVKGYSIIVKVLNVVIFVRDAIVIAHPGSQKPSQATVQPP
jgi:hypothetical protein